MSLVYSLRVILLCTQLLNRFQLRLAAVPLEAPVGEEETAQAEGGALTRGSGPLPSTLLILLRARPDYCNRLLGLGKGETLSAFLRSEQIVKGRLSGSWQVLGS